MLQNTNAASRPQALALAVSLALGSGQVAAATFTVTNSNDSGAGSLRDAVAQANANPGADQIDFSTGLSTITLSSGQIEISETLEITGPAGGQTISGGGASRILATTDAGAALTLENLVLIDGFNGAVIDSAYCDGFRGSGGAICAEGDLTLRNCTISGNVTTGDNSRGGGIAVRGQLTVESSVITGNTTTGISAQGGGISAYLFGPTVPSVTLTDTVISGNETQGSNADGGGLFVTKPNFAAFNVTVTLDRSAVNENITQGQFADGGGIAAIDVDMTLQNSTISSNAVTGMMADGGGLWGYDINASIYNTAVTANASADGAGGLHLVDPAIGSYGAALDSTILAANSGPEGNVEAMGNTLGAEFSLFGDAETEITFTNINNIFDDAPDLTTLGDQDCVNEVGAPGMTQCVPGHVPLTSSPALDSGQNSLGLSNDQRGPGFPRVVGSQIDIGALEAGPALNVAPSILDFGNVAVGDTSSTQFVTFSNPWNQAVTFNVSGLSTSPFSRPVTGCNFLTIGAYEVPAGGSCQFGHEFSPTVTGLQTETVTVTSSAPGTDQFVLQGTGVVPPALDITPNPLTFTPVPIGVATPPQTVTVQNSGASNVALGTLTITGGSASDFNLGSDGCSGQTLGVQTGVDDTCQFDVTFTPADQGTSQASVEVPSNSPNSPDVLPLFGASDGLFADRFEDN